MTDMVYVKVYRDFISIAEALDNGQRGRLFLAILQYINGIEPEGLSGAEYIAFLTIKNQIDRDQCEYSAKSEKNRANGRKGGRPRKANGLEENPKNRTVFCENQKTQEEDKEEEKDKEKDKEEHHPPTPQGAGMGMTVQRYARENLTTLGARAMDEINSFIDDLSEDIVRHAIDNALDHGARSWSYVRAILNRYCDEGIKTVGEAKASDEAFAQRKKHPEQAPKVYTDIDPEKDWW